MQVSWGTRVAISQASVHNRILPGVYRVYGYGTEECHSFYQLYYGRPPRNSTTVSVSFLQKFIVVLDSTSSFCIYWSEDREINTPWI